MDAFKARRNRLAAMLKESGTAMAILEDTEGRRDPSIRYLCGHPMDALLFINDEGHSTLVAWDVNMAAKMAKVDEILAYTDFGRSPFNAVEGMIKKLALPKGAKIDLPSTTPHPLYKKHVETCPDYEFLCLEESSKEKIVNMRAVKDDAELQLYRKLAQGTDKLMDAIEAGVKSGSLKTESDVALFIESELRANGFEGTGFETIAAGPGRSFGIHAFPSYTGAAFGSDGFSILDFGIVLDGYTSDVTMTFVRGNLNSKQEEMLGLVQKAYDEAVAMCAPGVKSRDIALRVDEIFAEKGYKMPHGLGHGVGLEAHEMPMVNSRETNTWVLAPGHIITIEPGLYDPEAGGVRLEDDVLITATGHEVLTHSRIVRF